MTRQWAPCLALGLCFGCGELPPTGEALGTARQALSLGEVVWEEAATNLPSARMGHALFYDPVLAATIAAGGRPVDDAGPSLSDTWAWDGTSWASVAAGLPPRGFISGAFDSGRGIGLTYGGLDRSAWGTDYFSDILERGHGAWSPRSGLPGSRSGTGLAYDEARGATILFGGFDGTAWYNDIWEWNGATWVRRCTSARCRQMRPSARDNAVFVYDPARQVTLMFGGFGEGQALGETWTWNGSTWSQRLPPISPSARYGGAAAYDPSTRRVFLFGGVTEQGEVDELWAWDGSTWEQLAQTNAPTARRDARLAWDTGRRRGVLFGGRSGTSSVDFWELSLLGNGCTSDDECHEGACIDGFCGGPPPASDVDGGAGSAALPAAGSGGGGGASGRGGLGSGAAGASGSADGGSLPSDESVAPSSRDDSFYGCTVGRGSRSVCWLWLGSLAALSLLRRSRP